MSSDEILASRGLRELIKFRGYTPHGYRDRSRDTLKAIDIWDLEVRVIPKNKGFREYILSDYKKDHVPALGSQNQVIGIHKDQHYLDSEILYLPIRLVQKRYYNIPESELDIFQAESREEGGVLWVGPISGLAPVRELMEKEHPLLLDQATHVIMEDKELTESSDFNNDPHNRDNYEIVYKPVENCNKWDCPICQPVERFGYGWRNAEKRTGHYFQGLALDHPRNVKFDKLMHLKKLSQYAVLSTMLLLISSPPLAPSRTRTLTDS